MNLNIFFDSIPEAPFEGIRDFRTVYRNIDVNHGNGFVPWPEADIALLGLCEYEASPENNPGQEEFLSFRQKLYTLKKGSGSYRIVDLGNLRKGPNPEETALRLSEVLSGLQQNYVLPIIIGGGHSNTLQQQEAFEYSSQAPEFTVIDARIDNDPPEVVPVRDSFLGMLLDTPLHDGLNLLAYQTYYTAAEVMDDLRRQGVEALRLGSLRQQLSETEPLFRRTNALSFDLSALSAEAFPANAYSGPFGLRGEEACQLCWYAGTSESVKSAGFYEYNPHLDRIGRSAETLAIMVWYLIEGFYHRRYEEDFQGPNFLRHTVTPIDTFEGSLRFYQSKVSGRWWMALDIPEADEVKEHFVPCNETTYLQAAHGQVPDLYFRMFERFTGKENGDW